jgi:hypothetical protein
MSDQLPIPSPDYTSLEAALKTYLKSRDELKDYDFDGSVLSTVVGMLAYNSTMNAFYLNQVANEAYLETASRRSSVVMNAQDLGYSVGSKSSAFAIVRLTLKESIVSGTTTISLPKSSAVFSASVNNVAFTFRCLQDTTLVSTTEPGVFVGDMIIYEGKQFTNNIVVDGGHIANGITLQNPDVDSSTIQVTVNGSTYTRQNNIVDGLNGQSKIFFVSDSYGYPKIEFGDGIIGKSISSGDQVKVSYLKSSGALPNGIGTFSFVGSYLGTTSSVETISAAVGGSEQESIASIKYNAPKWFESQGRAVTADDYKVIATKLFRNISDIIVWGGEQNDPPVYGKVFLSIKPFTGFYMTTTEKAFMVQELKKYNVVTVTPEIIDPDYVYVDISGSLEFMGSQTTYNESSMAELVINAVKSYGTAELGKFASSIRYSRIANVILDAESSIQSTKFTYTLSKHVTPLVGGYSDISVKFGNGIKSSSVMSSKFTFNNYTNCKFVDDGLGVIRVIDYTAGANIIVPNAGTVNYQTGEINITRTYLVSVDQSLIESTGAVYIEFSAGASDFDLNTTQRNIMVIDQVSMTATKV